MEAHIIKVCLDHFSYSAKPNKKVAAEISARIASCSIDIQIKALSEELVYPNGKTITPAYFYSDENGHYKKCNSQWAGQSLFLLDFDNGITINEVLERCRKYNVPPAFAYSTFSSNNNNKFRVAFCLGFEINDIKVRNLIQQALMALFPECDKSCCDPCRMFFGGKEIIMADYDARIDIEEVIFSTCAFISIKDPGHAKKNIKKFCSKIGLCTVNGMPWVERQCSLPQDFGETSANTIIYYYSRCAEFSCNGNKPGSTGNEYIVIHFSDETIDRTLRDSDKVTYNFKTSDEKRKRCRYRNYCWDKLYESCQLYQEFITSSKHLSHRHRFGIVCNLLWIEGGDEKALQGLQAREEYDIEIWTKHFKYIKEADYKPARCENFCPYHLKCDHAENMIHQGKLIRGGIQILDKPIMKSLNQAEAELSQAFNTALEADDDKVYVIKGQPGIGKTKQYLKVKNAVIAMPTHKLKDEVYSRMIEEGNNVSKTPQLPELEGYQMRRLKVMYSLGAYSTAAMYLRYLSEKEGIIAATKYLNDIEIAKVSDKTVLTTHERLLYFSDKQDLIIVDEDIIPTLLKQGVTKVVDLEYLSYITSKKSFGKVIEEIAEHIIRTPDRIIVQMPTLPSSSYEKLEQLVSKDKNISSNILGLLKCSHFVKYSGTIFYIIKRELPRKKTIILSATADEKMYRSIFGDRLVFIDIGLVETVGQLIQYPENSFTRYQFKQKKEELMEIVSSVAGDIPKISYKLAENDFKDSFICNFGACEGIDEYNGKDIAVIGTPHINPVAYSLYAAALGIKTDIFDVEKASTAIVERNGMRFRFMTYSEDRDLQDIQLYFIESELQQAVGRARILRNDCTVTVFSNYPLPGAQFRYLQ